MNAFSRCLPIALLGALFSSCGLNLFSEREENQLGLQVYAMEIQKHPEVESGSDYEMVKRAFERITKATGKDLEWEFRLLESETPNAFCLPGGKIAIFTGILPITETEDGLAAVMGHEVAHATMRHGGQRMTEATISEALRIALEAGVGMSDMDAGVQGSVMQAFGIASQLGSLSYGRGHETEADEVGIRYAIRAGYDPYAAVELWKRMAALAGAEQKSEWLSTHPHSLNRAAHLEEMIPKILAEEGRAPQQD